MNVVKIILFLLLVPVLTYGTDYYGAPDIRLREGEAVRLVFISDTHQSNDNVTSQQFALIAWINDLDPEPDALIHGGDSILGPTAKTGSQGVPGGEYQLKQALYDPDIFDLDETIQLWPVVGNWDTDTSNGNADEDGNPYDDYWGYDFLEFMTNGMPYYTRKVGPVTFMAVVCNVDTLISGSATYKASNPPGASDEENPDYSGFVTEGSAQWQWMIGEALKHNKEERAWLVTAGHRPIWDATAPTDSNNGRRPDLERGRSNSAMNDLIGLGSDIHLQGDDHHVSLTHKVRYSSLATDSVGIYALTIGTPVARFVTDADLPTDSKWFTYGSEDGTDATCAVIDFYGNKAHLVIYKNDDGVKANTSSIYDVVLTNNTGD